MDELIRKYIETEDVSEEIHIAYEINAAGVCKYINYGYSEEDAAHKAVADVIRR